MTLQEELMQQVAIFNAAIYPGAKVVMVIREPEIFLVLTDGAYYTYYRNNVYDLQEIMSNDKMAVDEILHELHRVWREFIEEMENEDNFN